MKKIIAFAVSNSKNSINHQLIEAVSQLLQNVEVEIINLRDYPAVIYGIDEEQENGYPDKMIELNEKLKEAQGYIISTPEHNGSMPAFFKNAIDWLSRIEKSVLNDLPTVFLSTSPGPRGASSAGSHLAAIMPYRGTKVIGYHSVGSFNEKVIEGKLIEGEDKVAIEKLIDELLNEI